MYWSAVVPLLERLQSNQMMFEYIGKEINKVELTHAIEEGKLLLAQKLIKDKLYEQAMDALKVLKCPEASFEQGKIYKTLADEIIDSIPKESVTSEIRSQHGILLTKAKNCFYLTLDRLRGPVAYPKHPLNSELCTYITLVENELKRVEPDNMYNDRNRNDCDDFSGESYSLAHSNEDPIITNSIYLQLNNSKFQSCSPLSGLLFNQAAEMSCSQTHSPVAGSTEEHNDSRLEDDYDGCTAEDERRFEINQGCTTMYVEEVTLFAQTVGDKEAWSCLGMCVLKVIYDELILGEAIIVKNSNRIIVSNTLTSIDTVMQCVGETCVWTATDYACECEPRIKRNLKAVFSNAMAAKKFNETFLRGCRCAQIANIRDSFILKAVNYEDFVAFINFGKEGPYEFPE